MDQTGDKLFGISLGRLHLVSIEKHKLHVWQSEQKLWHFEAGLVHEEQHSLIEKITDSHRLRNSWTASGSEELAEWSEHLV